ncbi:galactoside 2-alpha-L-fucosyltransferase-like [Coffea arabica]|uniref:Fucosyltransferase n=1 Tax=Coffea arabica TaxID=13443 RepID=A0A6P6X3V5_COFAR|nr:galactoside 2-alpha-L-fucosyltransferase-like [Coffea arabica]
MANNSAAQMVFGITAEHNPSLERHVFPNPVDASGYMVMLWYKNGSLTREVSSVLKDSSSDGIWTLAYARLPDVKPPQKANFAAGDIIEQTTFRQPVEVPQDKLLGGLLPAGLDEKSCLSRYQSVLYRKKNIHQPSSHLISRLRNYESQHKRCGPYTESYNRTLKYLNSNQYNSSTGCNYVVWLSFSGLGNRILSLASAFLYALLTNRVLLVDRGLDIPDLFCEPFPDVSWLLPSDFPLTDKFSSFNQKSPESYGNMLKNNVFANSVSSSLPAYVYLHLVHDYDEHDKLFFCDQDQTVLQQVPWLILKTDNYFIPSLFLIPSFEQELHNLFPEKGTVLHHLCRYLLNPTNSVWGLITRYYNAYLATADEKIGIQIRVFEAGPGPYQYVSDQILACVIKENLLPQINKNLPIINPPGKPKIKAVLITSLSSGYFEALRNMYWEHPTITGEIIELCQPSHEVYQQTEKQMHNRKAWAEMYQLSLMDKLVTSSWSTFGYVAQSLGGLRPWILYKVENQTAPDPPCQRAMSMEPCFHAPPFYDCKRKIGTDTGKIVPNVQHCEDMSWGLKLFDG